MAKKEAAALENQAQSPAEVSARKQISASPEINVSGFYIYIGPTIRRLIRNGTIYRGSRADARKAAKEAIQAFPLIKTLIVSGDALPEARLKLKRGGNALAVNYKRVADAAKEKAAAEAEKKEE